MKKFFLLLAALWMAVAGTVTAAEKELYGVLLLDGEALYIFYDENKASNSGVSPDEWSTYEFAEKRGKVESIVFHESVKDAHPTSLAYWFDDFYSVTEISNFSYLNTEDVTDMTYLFNDCMRLEEIDLSNLNTANVTKMRGMFRGCKALTKLDVSSFDMKKVTDTREMFSGCSELDTIRCFTDWSSLGITQSADMFKKCAKLKGGKGTAFDAGHVDVSYARPDGGTMAPGYFVENEVYGVLSKDGKTFTIRYDRDREEKKGVTPDEWMNYTYASTRENIKSVMFSSTMEDAHLTNTAHWFEGFSSVETFYDLRYFVTDEVTDMSYMFADCGSLTPYTSFQFLSTPNLVSAKGMFQNCTSLVSLGLQDFDMTKLEDATEMFSGCTNLETILCNRDWSFGFFTDDDMFKGCAKLQGDKGTAFDEAHIGKEYARPDGGEEQPGYFTSQNEIYGVFSVDGSRTFIIRYGSDRIEKGGVLDGKWSMPRYTADREDVQKVVIDKSMTLTSLYTTRSWFDGFINLIEIEHLENLRTQNVIEMDYMFRNCHSLEVLDLRPLSFKNVKTAYAMFAHCSFLSTIYCNVDLRNSKTLTDARNMFLDCPYLVGGEGTVYDYAQIDKAYAHLDGGTEAPGYFTELDETYGYFTGTNFYIYHDNYRFEKEFYRDEEGFLKNPCVLPEEWMDESLATKRSEVKTVAFSYTMRNAHLKNTAHWFEGFSSLKTINNLRYFVTDEVTDMSYMFAGCNALDTLDLYGLKATNATNMEGMFLNCKSLKVVDARTFDISEVANASRMFAGCESLETIICNADWSTYGFSSSLMFDGCINLRGDNNTTYSSDHTDNAYARPDGGEKQPGYFTKRPEIYGATSGSDDALHLTLYYDTQRGERSGVINWHGGAIKKTNVTGIALDKSMQDARPTSTAEWFYNFKKARYINHLDYLNTSEVTDMNYMFEECNYLRKIDLRSFDMRKVTNMDRMFYECAYASSILMPTSYQVENVTSMYETFACCYSLKEIDLHAFDTKKVTNMYRLFYYDESLESIYCEEDWSQREVLDDESTSTAMFWNCTSLVGSAGTEFDENFIGKAYARPDGGTEAPGYFSPAPNEIYGLYSSTGDTLTLYYDKQKMARKGIDWTLSIYETQNQGVRTLILDESMKEARPTDCSWWFSSFTLLRRIEHLDYLNTSEVTDMSGMFSDLSYLTYLDLRTFDFSKVETANAMFFGCDNLRFILCNEEWSMSETLKYGNQMFYYCSRLVGDHGTTFDADHDDSSYAHPDGGTGNPGYFSTEVPVAFYYVLNEETGVMTFYYDNLLLERKGEIIPVDLYYNAFYWEPRVMKVQKAVFDESVKAARLTSLHSLFNRFKHLQTIEHLDYLNTSEVTNMCNMFGECEELKSVDLRSFDISKVTDMESMFEWCVSLEKIYCHEDWSKSEVLKSSTGMFSVCVSLVGGAGTTYGKTDVSWARPDGGTEAPGYFTRLFPVTFLDKEGNEIATIDVEENKAADAPEAPIVEGYHFTGWDKDISCITSALTVTAQYAINVYTVTFVDKEDKTLKTEKVEHGNSATAPEAPSVEGYHFIGWDKKYDNVTSDLTIKAQYAINVYTVTFVDKNDKTIKTEEVEHGKSATAPKVPEVEGYHFTGWDKSFDKVTSDLTVKALYAINTYTVTFVDYDNKELKKETVEHGKAATAPADPKREGYTFKGWDKDFSNITADLTVKAQYTINTYTVTFIDKDGNTLKTEKVEYGKSATAPEAPVIEGWTFAGWDKAFNVVKSDLTVQATYTQNPVYTVTFKDWDGSVIATVKVEEGKSAVKPDDPIREGYTFTGWDKQFDNVTSDLTVTAQYAINTYTVTFVDYDNKELKKETVEWGKSATAPADPKREGYTFKGWDKDYSSIKSDLTVKALYAINTYTVTFVDYDNKELKKETVEHGKAATAPSNPTREGYTFKGWDKDFSNITADLTVKAQYTINTYTVTFLDKDGNTLKTEKVKYGKSATAPEPPVVEGWTFAGWDKAFNVVKSDLTVQATYTQNPVYTVTFVDWDGSIIATVKVEEGKSAVKPNDPIREGYTFTGWDKAFDKVTSDLTVTAQYAINVYTVKFVDKDGKTLKTEDVEYGKSATAPDAPAVEGYTFTGWDKTFDNVKSDLTVKAQYAINTYSVTFVDWDGAVLRSAQVVEYGAAAIPPSNPSREGYTFTGWDKDFSNVKSDLTVTAQYTINVYTVTFLDKDGKTLKTESVEYGKSATAPDAPVVEGWTFAGWDKAFNVVKSDLTVQATYTQNPVYTVTFVDWDGSIIATVKVEEGKSAVKPDDPIREGYTFIGWDKEFDNVTSDLTVTALYEEIIVVDYTPTNLSVVVEVLGDDDQQITLSWNAVDGAASYDLRLLLGDKELYAGNTFGMHVISLKLSEILQIATIEPGTYSLDWFVRSTDDKAQAISDWAQGETFEVTVKDPGQGIEDINANANANARKEMRNGLLYILRGGRTYDSNGKLIQ